MKFSISRNKGSESEKSVSLEIEGVSTAVKIFATTAVVVGLLKFAETKTKEI